MSLLRYPLVAALLGLFLGTLASNSTAGSDTTDRAPAESRDSKDSVRRDEAKPSSLPATDACAQ